MGYLTLGSLKAIVSSDGKSLTTYVGPIKTQDEIYLITRHSFPIQATINPFAVFPLNVWLPYGLSYLVINIWSVSAYINLKHSNKINDLISIWLAPSETSWLQMAKGGLMLQLIWTFALWTFTWCFGFDLWSVLMIQEFEPEVNGWEDLQWHKAQFFFFGSGYIQQNILEYNLVYLERENSVSNRFVNVDYNIDLATKLSNYIQAHSKKPSDIIMTMNK